jgi:hypothetical protein
VNQGANRNNLKALFSQVEKDYLLSQSNAQLEIYRGKLKTLLEYLAPTMQVMDYLGSIHL